MDWLDYEIGGKKLAGVFCALAAIAVLLLNLAFWLGLIAGALWLLRYFEVLG